MATLDDSPSLFIGKSWSDWAENAPVSPLDEHEAGGTPEKESDDTDSMRLPFEDMHMFGTCPSQDEFYLVMCERCQKVIKPQAFKQHLFERHGITESSASPKTDSSYPTSKLSSPSKLTSPTRTSFRVGHSVPTKASVKEVPPAVSNAQKVGINAKFKGLERGRRNHSMPVVKVERMEMKRVSSQHFESVSKSQVTPSPPSSLANGNSKDNSLELTDIKPVLSGVTTPTSDKTVKSLSFGSLPQNSVSLNCSTVTMATTTLTTASTSCVTTTKSVVGTTTVAVAQSLSNSGTSLSSKGIIGTFGSRSTLSMPSLSSSLISSSSGPSSSSSSGKKKPFKFEKPEKLIPCKDREYDCNKHCGVIVEDTGKSCTRSLTCKTHALSLRRKVPGRRKPFDDLLKEHREAKEILLKQKAEQKAALQAAAEKKAQQSKTPPVIPPGSSQLAAHLLRPTPLQSYNDQIRERSSHPPQLSLKKPAKPPQKLSTSLPHRPSLTSLHSPLLSPTKDDPGGAPSVDGHDRLSDGEGEEEESDKSDSSFLPYQPRPAAMCTFGGRLHTMGGRRSYVFGRRTDILRAAFLNVLEKQLNPPPPKKLCVESNLPKEPQGVGNLDPYDFTAVDPRLQQKQNPLLNSSHSHKAGSKSKSKSASNPNRSKSKDSLPGSRSPAQTNSAIPAASAGVPPLKRKRSGGALTNSSPSSLTAAAAPVLTTVSINNTSTGLAAIAIPSVNLSNATIGHFNANLSATGGKNTKNNVYKDVGFVVTNLDSSALVNGQYMITNAHQTQSLDEKALQQAHVINSKNSPKILNLETIQGLQKGAHNLISMPPLLLDGSMQPVTAVLTPVSLATTLSNQIVSVGNTTSLTPSNQNLINSIRAGAASPQVATSLHNGLLQPSSDKLVNNRHNVLHHKKPLHSQSAGGHGVIGNTMIATSTSPQVSQIYATHLLKPGNLLIGKPSNKFAVPTGSLTLNVASLGMSGVGQQPTLYIASNEEVSQQQQHVVSSPSHMT